MSVEQSKKTALALVDAFRQVDGKYLLSAEVIKAVVEVSYIEGEGAGMKAVRAEFLPMITELQLTAKALQKL